MEFKLEEKTIINVSLQDVFSKIEEDARKQGYEIFFIKPKFETKYENFGQYPHGESRAVQNLVGFECNAKRIK